MVMAFRDFRRLPDQHQARGRLAYASPGLRPLGQTDIPPPEAAGAVSPSLSPIDVLRIVQSAFDELGLPRDSEMAGVKLNILEEVSAGRLGDAVRLAIVAAGVRGHGGNG